ncbi:MAG: LysR family transcriptional regulator [Chloroflexota bacterium]
MDLSKLRSFCNAARLKSISKAAEHLALGQPTVSTHVKKLETELSVVLFDRVRRPIKLTSAGEALYELAAPLVAGMDHLVGQLKNMESAGSLSVAATSDIVSHPLLTVVRDFRLKHPDARLLLRSTTRVEAVELVSMGEMDLAIVPSPEGYPALVVHGTFTYDRVLITPLDHPLLKSPNVSLEEIAQWPLILKEPHTFTREMLETAFRRRALDYHVTLELESMDMIKRYVALGMGVGVGPELAIEPEDRQKIGIINLRHLLPMVRAGVVTLKGRYLSPLVKEFIDSLQGQFKEAG